MEHERDRIMWGAGTDEPWIRSRAAEFGPHSLSAQWRKPMRVDEINRLAPTPEVLERRGRP